MLFRRIALVLTMAAALAATGTTSAAAGVKPLKLVEHSVTIPWGPEPTDLGCDEGSLLYCGAVRVEVTFAGLADPKRPQPRPEESFLFVNGRVEVARTYGCEVTGRRLPGYDRVVRESVSLAPRRSIPSGLPAQGDTASATVYAFLPDSQPRNCPRGAQALTYRIEAKGARVWVSSDWEGIPAHRYSTPGKPVWSGAVTAPTSTP